MRYVINPKICKDCDWWIYYGYFMKYCSIYYYTEGKSRPTATECGNSCIHFAERGCGKRDAYKKDFVQRSKNYTGEDVEG